MKNIKTLIQYSLLGLPLAFVGLPIYVHLPHYYANVAGLSLALIGYILLGVRLLDALLDPFIGYYSDKTGHSRRRIILSGLIPLGVGFLMLFSPPDLSENLILIWLIAGLILTYIAFSVVMINYYAASVELQASNNQTLVSGVREGTILLGLVVAASLPAILQQYYPPHLAFRYFAFSFLPLLLLGGFGIYFALHKGLGVSNAPAEIIKLSELRHLKKLRGIYALFFINSLTTSITSTLFLFFVEDYIGAKDDSGYMLLCFFICAALSVPFWVWFAGKINNIRALRLAMLINLAAFIFTYFLAKGDGQLFYMICAVTGFAIGGELTLLPAIFNEKIKGQEHLSGIAYSVWHFLSKFNLAIAAGVILPLLQYLGYESGVKNAGLLLVFYALVPCAIKILSLALTFVIHKNDKTFYVIPAKAGIQKD
jgi:Na+/melibiose symporter-like transporter